MPGRGARAARRHRDRWTRRARSRPDSRSSFAASISAAMLEPRPEIRMATRLRAIASSRDRGGRGSARAACLCRRHDLAELHDASRPRAGARLRPRRLLRASTTAIMPMPQLKVRSISVSAMPPIAASHLNTGSTGTRVEIDARAQMSSAARAGCCREIRRR